MTTPRKSILNVQGYDIPLSIDGFRLKLDSNENEIGPSPKVIEALRSITPDQIKYYPAYGKVLEKLAVYNKVQTDMLLPANGADEAISYIFDALVEPDDTVLNVSPCFPMPRIYAGTLGCNYKEVPYIEKWVFPTDEFIKNIDDKTKLIIITTPNNPTGEAISEHDLAKVLKAVTNSYVLVDETYFNYAGSTFINLLSEYPNVIIARSMSKDFALAGLRFGYLIASKEIISHIKKVISPYSVNNIASLAACAALDDIEHLKYILSEVKEAKKMLADGLKPFARTIYKSDANFLLVDFGEKSEFIYKKLLKSGIKVKYFGKTTNLENCMRISIPSVKDTQYILDSLQPRDLIIFDMDGVMVDTSNSYRAAIQGVYEKFSGNQLTREQIQHAKNKGGLNNDWELTMYLLEQDGISVNFDEMVDVFQDLYWNKYINNETHLISPEQIAELAKKYDLAIFTGRPKPEAEFVLKKWGIEQYFSPIITMDDVPRGKHKPDPWGVFEILRITDINSKYAVRNAALIFYKKNLQGGYAERADIGKIRFTGKGIRKTLSSSVDETKLKFMPNLKDIIKNGEIGELQSPKKQRKDGITGFRYIKALVNLNGEEKIVLINLALDAKGYLFYNIHNKNKIADALPTVTKAGASTISVDIINDIELNFNSPAKRKIYYLGDTVDDMFAAKQAGVIGIGVLPPQDKGEDLRRGLKAHGAAEILEITEDLMQLLWTK